jgi:Protein of unknown function (DUF3551)
MRSILAGAAVLVSAFLFSGRDANAQGWCVYYDEFTYSCGFTSFRQCQATAFGGGGFCRRDAREGYNEGRLYRERRSPRYRDRDWR